MATVSNHGCSSVYIGNIPFHATEKEIVKVCEEVGPIVSFRLVTDPKTSRPKGYAFCDYKDQETALSACRNLHGYLFRGRELRVNLADKNKNAPAKPRRDDDERVVEQDPLSLEFAKMSISQLQQIMSELEALDVEQARTILLANPKLPKALFDAQLKLGVTSPRMLQMPSILQPLVYASFSDRTSKMMRFDDGRACIPPVSLPSQTCGTVGRQTSIAQETVNSGVQVNKMQIPSDVDPALLRQLLDLKPEQLISLPPDQQQQVFELQKMLRQATATERICPPTTCSREEKIICFSNQSFTV